MTTSFSKIDQALKDLVEAFSEMEQQLEEQYGDDEDGFNSAIIETLETSLETAMEEHDVSTGFVATVLTTLSEALEEIDPSAFEEDDEEVDYDLDEVDYDLEEDDEEDLEDEEEDE